MVSWGRHMRPVSEFIHFIAAQGHVEELLTEHVRTSSGNCLTCRRSWPCNMRRVGEEALELLRVAG